MVVSDRLARILSPWRKSRNTDLDSQTNVDEVRDLAMHLKQMGNNRTATYEIVVQLNRVYSGPLSPAQISRMIQKIYGDGESVDPGDFPHELLAPSGLLEEITDYNLAGAFRPQPVLALAGAIPLMATIIGRRITDSVGTRINIYTLGIAETGTGKERARQVSKDILFAIGQDQMIGPEGIASHAGLIAAIEIQPEILFQIDEIGRVLRTLNNPQKAPHLYHIATILMKLYTSSGTLYIGDAYADPERNKRIREPHASLYGTTVSRSFFEGLSPESLTDGFLSRMLVFRGEDDPDDLPAEKISILPRLVRRLRTWIDYRPGGNLSEQNPQPRVVPYTDAATAMIAQTQERARQIQQLTDSTVAPLWTRLTEKTRKLALIHAGSIHAPKDIVVDADSIRWGSTLAEYATNQLIYDSRLNLADSPFEADSNKILKILSNESNLVTKGRLCRLTRSMTPRWRDDILSSLIEAEKISINPVKTGSRGPVSKMISLNHE